MASSSLHQRHIPHHPSPKRKRATSTSDPAASAIPPFAPRLALDTPAASHRAATIEPASTSPRASVTRQLQSLQIHPLPAPPQFGEVWAQNKRARKTEEEDDAELAVPGVEGKNEDTIAPPAEVVDPGDDEGHSPPRISEPKTRLRRDGGVKKPGAEAREATRCSPPRTNWLRGVPVSRSPSPYALDAGLRVTLTTTTATPSVPSIGPFTTAAASAANASSQPGKSTTSPIHRPKSPPLPSTLPTLTTTTGDHPPPAKPHPDPKDDDPDSDSSSSSSPASHTWLDAEITGHLVQDPDDDGTGINGIGFRPTPAIAWARSQKRKRQLAEWRAREAREARARRFERRRGGASGMMGGGGGIGAGTGAGRRVVRFA